MPTRKRPRRTPPLARLSGITSLTISGYKSISTPQTVELRPLTILAGTNSSGKSSIMQPLLLLKQTLESSYDPGPLLLNAANVRFTSMDQFLSLLPDGHSHDAFSIGLTLWPNVTMDLWFQRQARRTIDIKSMRLSGTDGDVELRANMSSDEVWNAVPHQLKDLTRSSDGDAATRWAIVRNRCFLAVGLKFLGVNLGVTPFPIWPVPQVEQAIRSVIHLPGLRGNPERTYPVAAISPTFPGTFQEYCASVIAYWQNNRDSEKLRDLSSNLKTLGLTSRVLARSVTDAQVELRVSRLAHSKKSGTTDMVSIADVGVGVSQTLPVLVALLVAEHGQLVYIEQPEIHLHPRAQVALADILANAALRGVQVVAETHSSLLLLGIQALVAEGRLPPDLIRLHWFQRNADGATEISSAELDETGAFGEWPEDFGEVTLEAQSRYLDAAETRQLEG